jgi:hypothetical protein
VLSNGPSAPATEVGVGTADPRMIARGGELVVTWENKTGGTLAVVTPP